jgi:hypothetical protein
MRKLLTGQIKVIKSSKKYAMFKFNRIKVIAECVDVETPSVTLEIDGPIVMCDTETLDLIERLQNALSILPTSK